MPDPPPSMPSLPERLGVVVGRHGAAARAAVGLALIVAAFAALALCLRTGERPAHPGRLGAILGGAAVVYGWRLWRPPWEERDPSVGRPRTVVAAACLAPLATLAILGGAWFLHWGYLAAT